jgi:hypothetical protein
MSDRANKTSESRKVMNGRATDYCDFHLAFVREEIVDARHWDMIFSPRS